jgi:hypothetical protein
VTPNENGGSGWSPARRNDDAPPSTTSAAEDTPEDDNRRAPLGSHTSPATDALPVASVLDELRARAAARQVDGVTRADENADDWWKSSVDQAIRYLAETGRVFDAYAVAELGVPEPDHPNRWGSRFKAAARDGVIVPVGYARSRRPTVAGAAVRTWRGVVSPPNPATS